MLSTGSIYEHGLWIASALAISNVVTDIFRKRALEPNSFYSVSFRLRLIATVTFGVIFAIAVGRHGLPVLHHVKPLPGLHSHPWPVGAEFIVYLLIDTTLVAITQVLYLRALQTSDLSYFLPFVSLTPVMLLPTGFFLIGELPLPHQIAGVLLIVAGSLAMNSDRLRLGWHAFLMAPFERTASRYAVIIALLFALSNPVDKILVSMSDPFFYAFAYSIALTIFFGGLLFLHRTEGRTTAAGTRRWVLLGGSLDALTLLLQFTAYRYLDVILVIAVKRAGVILSVIAGWLFFRERNIAERLFATAIMAVGILLIYLPGAPLHEGRIAFWCLAAFVVRIGWKRYRTAETR